MVLRFKVVLFVLIVPLQWEPNLLEAVMVVVVVAMAGVAVVVVVAMVEVVAEVEVEAVTLVMLSNVENVRVELHAAFPMKVEAAVDMEEVTEAEATEVEAAMAEEATAVPQAATIEVGEGPVIVELVNMDMEDLEVRQGVMEDLEAPRGVMEDRGVSRRVCLISCDV